MDSALMHRLAHFLEKNDSLRGEPALDEEIRSAEEKLNIKFHSDYKDFVKRFGGAYAGISIHAFCNGASLGKETVTGLTLDFRVSFTGDERSTELNQSYVASITGSGDPIIINPSGEVVILYHDSDEREVLAASLEELLQENFQEW